MRRLPDNVYRCPACGSEVIPIWPHDLVRAGNHSSTRDGSCTCRLQKVLLNEIDYQYDQQECRRAQKQCQ